MTEVGSLVWKITGDKSGLDKTLKESEKSAKKTGGIFSSMAKKVGAAIAGIGFVKFGKDAIKAASDAEETSNKFGVVFSSIQKEANEAARNLQQNFGLSGQAAQKLLADTGDLLTGFGFTQQEALKLSTQVNILGADLASFTNIEGGAERASEALTAAMLGEAERAKALGIVINQNSKEYKDLVAYYVDVEGKTLQQAKAYTALHMATKQSTNAIGDFARSQDSFANVSKRINAMLHDQSVEIGLQLTPALADLGVSFIEASKDGGVFMGALKRVTASIGYAIKGITTIIDTINFVSLKGKIAGANAAAEKLEKEQGKILDRIEEKYGAVAEAQGVSSLEVLREFAKGSSEEAKRLSADYKDVTQRMLNARVDASGFAKEQMSISDRLQQRFKQDEAESNKEIERREKEKKALEAKKKALEAIGETVTTVTKKTKTASEKMWAELTFEEKLERFNNTLQGIGSQILGVLSAAAALTSQIYSNRLNDLDLQMQKELEAAGVAEQTTVEQAQLEYDTALKSGTDLEKVEKKRALDKAKIEEKYAKRKAQLEYEAAYMNWKFQLASAIAGVPLATMNAFASGWAAGPVMGPILAPAYASLAGTAASIQLAAVSLAKPEPPKFATGGIIPGTTSGTQIIAGENNRPEAVLNQGQMQRFMDIADGRGNTTPDLRPVAIDSAAMFELLFQASQNGELFISSRGVID